MSEAILMISNRDHVIRSIYGSCRFKKDVPTMVSPYLVDEALAVGILPADVDDINKAEPATPEVPTTQRGRRTKIEEAIAVMEARMGTKEGREDWTAGRRPKVAVISKLVGFKVHSDEINRIISERNEKLNAEMLEAKKNKAKGVTAPSEKEPEGGKDFGE